MGAQEEAAKLERLPDALMKRHRVIELSEGGVLVVERWSISKSIYVFDFLANVLKGLPDDINAMAQLSAADLAVRMIKALGEKVTPFLELSVRPEDRGRIADLPADDALDLLVAVIELNFTEKFAKKVQELPGLFKSRWPANGKAT
jgi:hypothetical protein